MKEQMYFDGEEIEEVYVSWSEGYRQITVTLKNGEEYTVESDN